MSHLSSSVEVPYDLEQVSPTQALASVKGSCHAQRILMLTVGVIYAAASTFIVGSGFFLAPPQFICADGRDCTASEACEEGGYSLSKDSIHSMVYEWKLVCGQQYQASLIGSCYFLGLIAGSISLGRFTDVFGRKKTCIWTLFGLGTTLLLGAIASSSAFIDIVSFISGSVDAIVSVAGYLLLNEMLSTELRGWYSGLAFSFWSLGTLIVSLLFYFLDDWRHVMLVCAGIPFFALFCTVYQPESIRWLVVTKRDTAAALVELRMIAVRNGIDPNLVHLQPLPMEEEQQDCSVSTLNSGFKGLFASRKMKARLLGINFLWITVNIVYFGTLMCISTYHGNVYLNGVILSLGETIPNVVVGRYADRMRRKAFICGSCLVGSACAVAVWVLGRLPCGDYCVYQRLSELLLLLVTMMSIAVFFLLIYIYTAELFPTKVRGAGYSLCSTTCRLGGLLASNLLLIEQYTGAAPLLIIAGSLLLSVPPALSLPETLGQPLLDYH